MKAESSAKLGARLAESGAIFRRTAPAPGQPARLDEDVREKTRGLQAPTPHLTKAPFPPLRTYAAKLPIIIAESSSV